MGQEKERKNETILEFLEGSIGGLDDSLSTPVFCGTWFLYGCDI
jgi:hypothetical protein